MRAFFERHRGELPRVAFFVTCHGNGAARTLRQMAALADREPVTTLAVRARDLDALPFDDLEYFVDTVDYALRIDASVTCSRAADVAQSNEPLPSELQ